MLEVVMEAFWLSSGMIFLAELGDKTQLVAMTLAARFNARTVLAGIFVATLLVHVFSALIGGAMGKLLPADWISFLAGAAFIFFGFWTLKGDILDEEEKGRHKRSLSPFRLVTLTFFLAELGDKTMLSTVTLATIHPFIPVWLGSTLGMVLSDGLAILVGQVMGARLPERAVAIGAAVIFFGFGLSSMVSGARKLGPAAWITGAVLLVGCLLVFLYLSHKERSRERVTGN
jgi:putative Ca2+/H+ antiporter (TMEM165/GDT1 family)